jgi:hypothetical protein
MPQAELVKLRGQSIASLSKDATQKIRALPLTFDDPKQLNYIQLLDSTMAKCVKHLQCFDMLDVFQIVFPDANGILEMDSTGTTARSVSLFTHFTELEVGQVAASNRWYNTFTNDAVDQAATNLDWSYTFFSNNIEAGLLGILSERYNRYPEEEQGGPLLYMLLMKELFFVAKQTAKTLHAQLKRYRIDKIPGENIKNVSTIVMSVSRRIWFSKKKEFPDDYIKTVLQLYQTSSVARFNDHFKSLQFDYEKEKMTFSVDSLNMASTAQVRFKEDIATIQWLTDGAKHVFEECNCDGIWTTAVKTKAGDQSSDSHVLSTTVTCFNCGKSHHLNNCPNPPNETRIAKNKAAYRKKKEDLKSKTKKPPAISSSTAKSGSSGGSDRPKSSKHPNQFRPPDNNETKRVIRTKANGEVVYSWNPSTKRWDPDSSSINNVTGTVAPTPVASVPTDDTSVLRAQIAELQRQMIHLNSKI